MRSLIGSGVLRFPATPALTRGDASVYKMRSVLRAVRGCPATSLLIASSSWWDRESNCCGDEDALVAIAKDGVEESMWALYHASYLAAMGRWMVAG